MGLLGGSAIVAVASVASVLWAENEAIQTDATTPQVTQVRINTVGHLPDGRKQAMVTSPGETFTLVRG